jgi:hypothetical protein
MQFGMLPEPEPKEPDQNFSPESEPHENDAAPQHRLSVTFEISIKLCVFEYPERQDCEKF